MKVPTYHKFGLTKAGIQGKETRDKKISDILTHHLTIIIGLSLGVAVYIIYYKEVQPSTFIQVVMQIFLFASMGVLCVGIPAVLFKLAEMLYFKHVTEKSAEHKTITQYNAERDEFDFWKIRRDFSFWRILDGLSFEKEVMNIYMHLGYEIKEEIKDEIKDDIEDIKQDKKQEVKKKVKQELKKDIKPETVDADKHKGRKEIKENAAKENPVIVDATEERVICKGEKCSFLFFHTRAEEITETEMVDMLLLSMDNNNCSELSIFSQKGFHKKVTDYSKNKPVNLYDINGIIKIVRSIHS